MKLMIASDIHGSAFYCRQLLDAFEKEKPDKLILLGDILYHGPRNDLPEQYSPKEVIKLLSPLKDRLICVKGNCDTEVDQMVLDFPILSPYCVLFLGGRTVYASHGHIFNKSTPPPLCKNDILINGHTHVPECCETEDGFIYMNAGSVSIPKENSEHQYMIFENDTFLWKELSGRVLRTFTL
ncbi:MAG: phosphodiesterase [Ruminococcus sp.]|nr:phosphodiesterase [Ruminococcus sp.]